MKIYIKTLTERTFTLNVEPNDSVSTLKEKLCNESNMPVDQQRLFFDGKQLE